MARGDFISQQEVLLAKLRKDEEARALKAKKAREADQQQSEETQPEFKPFAKDPNNVQNHYLGRDGENRQKWIIRGNRNFGSGPEYHPLLDPPGLTHRVIDQYTTRDGKRTDTIHRVTGGEQNVENSPYHWSKQNGPAAAGYQVRVYEQFGDEAIRRGYLPEGYVPDPNRSALEQMGLINGVQTESVTSIAAAGTDPYSVRKEQMRQHPDQFSNADHEHLSDAERASDRVARKWGPAGMSALENGDHTAYGHERIFQEALAARELVIDPLAVPDLPANASRSLGD